MRKPGHPRLCSLLLAALALSNQACRRGQAGAPPRAERVREEARAAATWDDSDRDGIPDRAELRSFNDRENFTRWFTAIAEEQFHRPSKEWNEPQRDCSGLVRFSWREALRRHDRAWLRRDGGGLEPVAPDVSAYTLEDGPLGEKLFRTAPGPFRESDLKDGNAFDEFADARTLKDFNTEFVSRDRRRARPGDLLFFHQPWAQKYPYHVMIFLGSPRRAEDVDGGAAGGWVVYHTGATAADAGTVKLLRLADLDRHPQARWRPLANNPRFLGFYRLKILE